MNSGLCFFIKEKGRGNSQISPLLVNNSKQHKYCFLLLAMGRPFLAQCHSIPCTSSHAPNHMVLGQDTACKTPSADDTPWGPPSFSVSFLEEGTVALKRLSPWAFLFAAFNSSESGRTKKRKGSPAFGLFSPAGHLEVKGLEVDS